MFLLLYKVEMCYNLIRGANMKPFIVLICKIIGFILNKFNKGSAYPGSLALKIDENIFNYFKMPKITIAVTGTTGKTTISNTLTAIYKHAGFKVANNTRGSNLKAGILTCLIENTNILGKIKADVLILEIDERYVKKVIEYIKPNYFIINNLSRDQLARNGHFDIVWEDINAHISSDIHLVLNADDPLISKFSLYHKGSVTFYGLSKTIYSKNEPALNTLDLVYCPICNKKLRFTYYHYGNLGNYECPNNDFKRVKPDYEAKLVSDSSFMVDNVEIKMNSTSLYNVYNLLACYTVASLSNIPKEKTVEAINNLSLKIKRLDIMTVDNKDFILLLSKNETPISYNQSLEYVSKQKEPKTVVIGFDRISGRYNLKDLSWLWDINFEMLNDDSINKIICVGTFAHDIAVRLKYANVIPKKIVICLSSDEMLKVIKKHSLKRIYCILYFDVEKKFKKMLKQEA